jgi:hypothetical protein
VAQSRMRAGPQLHDAQWPRPELAELAPDAFADAAAAPEITALRPSGCVCSTSSLIAQQCVRLLAGHHAQLG